MKSHLAISPNVNVKLVESLVVNERKCCANEQYSSKEYLTEAVSDNAYEDKIQGALIGINVAVDTNNLEKYQTLKNIDHKKLGCHLEQR